MTMEVNQAGEEHGISQEENLFSRISAFYRINRSQGLDLCPSYDDALMNCLPFSGIWEQHICYNEHICIFYH